LTFEKIDQIRPVTVGASARPSICIAFRAVHMGVFEVKGQVLGFMGSSPAVVSNPRFEPVSMT
jgi:hypothetical protein